LLLLLLLLLLLSDVEGVVVVLLLCSLVGLFVCLCVCACVFVCLCMCVCVCVVSSRSFFLLSNHCSPPLSPLLSLAPPPGPPLPRLSDLRASCREG